MRKIAVPALCLLLGIGLGIGLAIIGMMPSRRLLPHDDPAPAEVRARTATAAGPRDVAPRPVERPEASATDGDDRRLAAEMIASVDAGELEIVGGSGQITGRVTDEAHVPLEGVTVTATVQRESESRRRNRGRRAPPADDRSLEDQLAETVRDYRFTEENRRGATTDDQGFYLLADLGDAFYRLRAEFPGYEIESARTSWRGVKAGASVDFIAVRTLALHVEVRMPGDELAEEADLRIKSRGDSDHERWTPERSSFDVEPGSYELRARYESGDEVLVSDEVSIEVAFAGDPPHVALQLHETGGIRGRVIMPPGAGDRGVFVHVLRTRGDSVPELRTLAEDGNSDWAERDSGFEYKFTDLDAGTYSVGVTRFRERMLMAMTSVVVAEAMVDLDLQAKAAERNEYVVVWVRDPEGQVLRDVNVGSGLRNERGAFDWGPSMRQDDGSWWVFHPEDLEEHTVGVGGISAYIAASSDEFGRVEKLYDPRSASQVELQFDPPASLEVTLLGFAGHPQALELSLSLEQQTDDGRGRRMRGRGGEIDEQGRGTYERLAPGDYGVSLYLRGEGRSWTLLERAVVGVDAAENHLSLRIPPLYRLTVNAPEMPPRSRIRIRSLEPESRNRGRSESLDETGGAIFEGLPGGEYRLSGSAGSMTVNLSGSATVRFEPRTEDALIVEVDPGGYLAQAGLRSGDQVIGIGDVEMHNHHQIRGALIEAAQVGQSVSLRVLRGGAALEIIVDGARLRQPDSLGGSFEPGHR